MKLTLEYVKNEFEKLDDTFLDFLSTFIDDLYDLQESIDAVDVISRSKDEDICLTYHSNEYDNDGYSKDFIFYYEKSLLLAMAESGATLLKDEMTEKYGFDISTIQTEECTSIRHRYRNIDKHIASGADNEKFLNIANEYIKELSEKIDELKVKLNYKEIKE